MNLPGRPKGAYRRAQRKAAPVGARRFFTLAAALLLSACGAEVAGTAAKVGALQASQAQAAKAQQQQIVQQMSEAMKAGEARASEAAR